MRRLRSPLVGGGTIVAVLVSVAVFAPLLAPYDPKAFSGDALEQPSVGHVLGTDNIGQDIFSQLVWGARSTLIVALAATFLLTVVGAVVGMAAGLIGGVVDVVAMRCVDVMLALPGIPLMVVIAALAGPSRGVLIVVIALIGWPLTARTVRSQALSLRQRGFVAAARGFGGGVPYLLRRHVMPNLAPVVLSGFVYWFPVAVFLQAGLAFLGLGDPTDVSWGQMLNRAVTYHGLYFTNLWVWWVLPAGFAITLTVLGVSFLGTGLEPWVNPRVRRGP